MSSLRMVREGRSGSDGRSPGGIRRLKVVTMVYGGAEGTAETEVTQWYDMVGRSRAGSLAVGQTAGRRH